MTLYPDHRYGIGQGLQTRSLSMQPPDYSLSFPAQTHQAEPENTSSFHFPSFHKFSPIPHLHRSATSNGVLDSLVESSSSQDLIQLTLNESQSPSGQYNSNLDLGQLSSSEPTVTKGAAKTQRDSACIMEYSYIYIYIKMCHLNLHTLSVQEPRSTPPTIPCYEGTDDPSATLVNRAATVRLSALHDAFGAVLVAEAVSVRSMCFADVSVVSSSAAGKILTGFLRLAELSKWDSTMLVATTGFYYQL